MSLDIYKAGLELALDQSMALFEAEAEVFAPNGLAWNEEELDDREFVLKVLDLQGPNPDHPDFPTWMFLEQVNQKLYAEWSERFERAKYKSLLGSR